LSAKERNRESERAVALFSSCSTHTNNEKRKTHCGTLSPLEKMMEEELSGNELLDFKEEKKMLSFEDYSVLVVMMGTKGEILPRLAFCAGLKSHNWRVGICTHAVFEVAVRVCRKFSVFFSLFTAHVRYFFFFPLFSKTKSTESSSQH
jgi:hypothetical protein